MQIDLFMEHKSAAQNTYFTLSGLHVDVFAKSVNYGKEQLIKPFQSISHNLNFLRVLHTTCCRQG